MLIAMCDFEKGGTKKPINWLIIIWMDGHVITAVLDFITQVILYLKPAGLIYPNMLLTNCSLKYQLCPNFFLLLCSNYAGNLSSVHSNIVTSYISVVLLMELSKYLSIYKSTCHNVNIHKNNSACFSSYNGCYMQTTWSSLCHAWRIVKLLHVKFVWLHP